MRKGCSVSLLAPPTERQESKEKRVNPSALGFDIGVPPNEGKRGLPSEICSTVMASILASNSDNSPRTQELV